MAEFPLQNGRPAVGSAARTSEEGGTLRAGSLRVSAGSAARLSEDQRRSESGATGAEMGSASINLRARGGRIFTPRPVDQVVDVEEKPMNTGASSPQMISDSVSHLQSETTPFATSRLTSLFRTFFHPDEK